MLDISLNKFSISLNDIALIFLNKEFKFEVCFKLDIIIWLIELWILLHKYFNSIIIFWIVEISFSGKINFNCFLNLKTKVSL